MCERRLARNMLTMSAQAWWRLLNGAERDLDRGQAPHAHGRALTIRYAGDDDAHAIEQLAALDSSRPPRGVVLLAAVDGALWAAVSLDDDHLIADPFRPSGELAFLLARRARAIRRAERGRMWRLPRVWPAHRADEARLAH
jgi:hypothetical protein